MRLSSLTASTALTGTLALMLSASAACALPAGGQLAAGQLSITSNANQTTITQTSSRAVVNWSSFNLGSAQSVHFNQPSAASVTLNRVSGDAGYSQINGQITANGNVWIMNPNGIVFGNQAQVNVGGMLATTSQITNQNFMQAKNNFTPGGNPNAGIVNNGSITVAQAGLAALVAPNVVNNGTIAAKLGKVQLASGDSYTLDMYGDGLVNLQASPAITSQLVSNSGAVSANGGTVTLTAAAAGNVVDSLINMDGVIESESYGNKTGSVTLYAEGSNAVQNNVAANKDIRSGSSTVVVSGVIDASGYGTGQKGGTVQVLADNVGILSGAAIDASGSTGGGTVRIGGDFHGAGTTPTALHTIVQGNTSIKADAITQGNGGNVTVWADDWTQYAGAIEAKGGAESGIGGYVETSGHNTLSLEGSVNASAANGQAGTWLLDPNNVTISSSSTTNAGSAPNFSDTGSPANVAVGDIQTALNGGTSVSVTASGSISVNNSISESTYTGTESLTLAAGTDITLGTNVAITASGNSHLNVTLDSDASGAGGAIVLNSGSSITSNGGNIVMGGGANPATGYALGDAANAIGINIGYNNTTATVNAGTGSIIMNGTGYATATNSNYGIYTGAGSMVETSGTGTMALTGIGGGTGASTSNAGIRVNGTVKDTTGAGTITLIGYGGDSGGTGVNNLGLDLTGTVTSVSGNIVLDGNTGISGQAVTTSTGANNYGIYNTGTISTTGSATIALTGVGGGTGAGGSDVGIYNIGTIQSTASGGGSLTLIGYSGDIGGSGASNAGVFITSGGAVTSVDGNIVIDGNTGISGQPVSNTTGGGGSSTNSNYGVFDNSASASIASTGNATITIAGIGVGSGGSSVADYGVDLYNSGTKVTSAAGNISITGIGATTGAGFDHGVYLGAGTTVQSTGAATVSIIGYGGGSGAGTNGNDGIYNGGTITSVSGNIVLDGNTGISGQAISNLTGSGNDGIYNTGTISTTGSATIALTGVGGGTGAGGSDIGVYNTGTIKSTAAGGGGITLVGYGGDIGGSGASNAGVFITSGGAVTSVDGNIVIDGNTGISGQPVSNTTGGGGSSSNSNYGVFDNSASASIASTGNATITIAGIGVGAGGSSVADYGVDLYNSGTKVTSAAGNISITGIGATTGAGLDHGVYLGAGTTVQSTGAATVSIIGYGGGSGAGTNGNDGIYNGGTITSVSGNIVLDGNTGISGQAVSNLTMSNNDGIYNTGTISTTGSATITLTGVGGGTGAGGSDIGIYNSGTIQSTASGGGSLTLIGYSGDSGGTGSSNYGTYVTGTGTITSVDGNIVIDGNTGISGQAVSNTTGVGGSSYGNYGLFDNSASTSISSIGNATITITGMGAGSGASNNDYGVDLYNSGTKVTSAAGNISITGTGASTTGGGDAAVYLGAGTTVQGSGAGTVSITGYGGGSGAVNNDYGIYNGGTITSASGNIVLDGNTGISGQSLTSSTGSGNDGIYNTGTISTTGSATVALTGVGAGTGAGGSDYGIYNSGTIQSTASGGGSLTLIGYSGDSGGTGSSNHGIYVTGTGAITSVSGNIVLDGNTGISGQAVSNTTGSGNQGIYNTGTISTTGSATVALTGVGAGTGAGGSDVGIYNNGTIQSTASGGGSLTLIGYGGDTGGSGGNNRGIYVAGTGTVSSVDGNLLIEGNTGISGQAVTTATGGGNSGVFEYSGNTSISSTGNATITITGIGAGSGVSSGDEGVYLAYPGTKVTSSKGNISITGVGASTTGGSDDGVYLSSGAVVQSTGSAMIGVTGAGGSGSGNYNYGLEIGGTVQGTGGGVVTLVSTAGDITLDSGAAISSLASGNALIIASAANFTNNAGSGALSATNGRWLVYSATPGGDTFGNLNSGNTAVWDAIYGGTITQTGDRYVFAYQPIISFISQNIGKIYGIDGTAAVAADFTVSGLQAGVANAYLADTNATAFSGAPSVTSLGSTALAQVSGGPYAVSVSQGTLAAIDGYALSYSSTGLQTITPATLTGVITANNKVYDGTTTATLSSENLSGTIYGSDASKLSLTNAAANFNTKDVLTANTVTATGLALGGSPASDYKLSSTSATAAANITPATLTASLTGTVQKIYDGTTAATLTASNYSLSGVIAGDNVALNDPVSGTYDNANFGTRKTVFVDGLALSGTASGNYRLASTDISGPVGEIGGRVVYVTANNETKLYGASLPLLTYSYTDEGNLPVSFTGGLFTPATVSSVPGAYAILQGSLLASSNYDLLFSPALLTVTALPNTVTQAPVGTGFSMPSYAATQFVKQPQPTTGLPLSSPPAALYAISPAGNGPLLGLIYVDDRMSSAFGLTPQDLGAWTDGIVHLR